MLFNIFEIHEKYVIRSRLGLDLVDIAKELNDRENLLTGYSTAFYSDPTLRNLTFYIYFIVTENMTSEIGKLRESLNKTEIPKSDSSYYSLGGVPEYRTIFSLDTAKIGIKALIIDKFLLIRPNLYSEGFG